jgi:hypothetical protein
MISVDNSAMGNCMYEAYSISLMYYLRSKNNPRTTETVLNKFDLTEAEKNILTSLITENRGQEFSREIIRDIIEPVLATKARALGARQTRKDFINSPTTTGLYASAQYGLEYYFKLSLHAHSESNFLASDFTDRDYIDAEIYKVTNIKNTMIQFASQKSGEVHARFESEWAKIKDTTEPMDVEFYKTRIIDNIITEKTIEFFTENNYRNLDAYINRLATNYVWGTEETLLTLNRAVQGEYVVRDELDRVDVYHDTVINLQIRVNGRKPLYDHTENPDIILNNSRNVHWTSLIPRRIFDPELVQQLDEQLNLEIQLDADLTQQTSKEEQQHDEQLDLEIQQDTELTQQTSEEKQQLDEQLDLEIQLDTELTQQTSEEKQQLDEQLDLELQQDAELTQQTSEEKQQLDEQLDLEIQLDTEHTQQTSEEEQQVDEQLDLEIQLDTEHTQQTSEEKQQLDEQLDLEIQLDTELTQQTSEEEQQVDEQLDLEIQLDTELTQQTSEEEQQVDEQLDLEIQLDTELTQQTSEEEQQLNERMDLVTQQEEGLAQRITAEDEIQDDTDVQVVLMDETLDNNNPLQDGQLVNPTDSATTTNEDFVEQQTSVSSSSLQSTRTLTDEIQPIALTGTTAQNDSSLAVKMATNTRYLAANKKFDTLITELNKKVANLNERAISAAREADSAKAESLIKAYDVAQTLLEDLVKAKSTYDVNPNQEAFKKFKTQCDTSIEKSRPELEQHRGWKQLLGNILLAVLGFGVVYLAAAAINKAVTGNFLFFNTKSSKIVNDIKSNLDELEPTQLTIR